VPRLVVVFPLEPLGAGDGFSLRDWPLHLTVAPTFTGIDLTNVQSAITPILASRRPLRLRVGPDEGFGHSMTIPVSVVVPSAELTDLHVALMTALLDVGAEFDDPEFVGAGYRAHVTMTRRARVHEGDWLDLCQVAIVDMAPEGDQRLRRVVWTATLTQRH
jgi:2'-5' RNA ligase superfamily